MIKYLPFDPEKNPFSTIVKPPIFNSLRVLKVRRRQLRLFSQRALMNCLVAISLRIALTFS